MPDEDQVLSEDVLFQLDEIAGTELLVGIPSYNTEDTIEHVVTAVEGGLRKHFPDLKAVICISDGGSTDRTLAVAQKATIGNAYERLLVNPNTAIPQKLCLQYRGTPGKGSAFRSIFEVATRLGASACAVVDADLRSITPYWIDRLLRPVVDSGCEYVAPVYSRHKYDGTITNSIAYPLTTALYGTRIRQPIGGEFAFSGDLAKRYASTDAWDSDVARFGIDIWMTTLAIVEGYRTCQTILGAKIHAPKDPGSDLGPMFRQVVGSLFALAGQYAEQWQRIDSIEVPQTFGYRAAYSAEPIKVSVSRLTWRFVEGYVRHQQLWEKVLSEESLAGVRTAVGEAADKTSGLVVDADLWTKIFYDFLIAYNAREVDPGSLLDSLIPLYFARTATFVQEARDDTPEQAEQRVEEAVDTAVQLKPYLKRRWKKLKVRARTLQEQPVPEEGEEEGFEGALETETK
ncbi:MAG: glycosyltransferase [Actinomycetota bacterium]